MGRSSPPSRRSLLRAGALSTTAALSGCLFGFRNARSRPEKLSVSVYNNTESAHAIRVRVLDPATSTADDAGATAAEAEAAVFDQSFYLRAGEEETRATDLTGTEYRVLASVDGELELDDTWHWAGCRTDEVSVTFWSSAEGSATGVCSQD